MELDQHKPRAQRVEAWAPVEVRPPDRSPRMAILHNASATGLLLSARSKLKVGDTLELQIVTRADDGEGQTVAAEVVRLDAFAPESHWPWCFGVRFEEKHEELIEELLRRAGES